MNPSPSKNYPQNLTQSAVIGSNALNDSSQHTQYTLSKLLLTRVVLRRSSGYLYIYNGIIYKKLTDEETKSIILEYLQEEIKLQGHSSILNGILTFVKAEPDIESEPFISTEYICFRNGVLDMDRKMLMPHTKRLFFTSYIDAAYSTANTATPTFDAFLYSIADGNPVLIERIWQTIGYILVPDNNAKRFVLLCGVGNSGKSVFGNLMSSLFNAEAVSYVDIFRLGDKFSSSPIVGKRLNISMDLPNSKLNYQAVSTIKMLTGSDQINIEAKFR